MVASHPASCCRTCCCSWAGSCSPPTSSRASPTTCRELGPVVAQAALTAGLLRRAGDGDLRASRRGAPTRRPGSSPLFIIPNIVAGIVAGLRSLESAAGSSCSARPRCSTARTRSCSACRAGPSSTIVRRPAGLRRTSRPPRSASWAPSRLTIRRFQRSERMTAPPAATPRGPDGGPPRTHPRRSCSTALALVRQRRRRQRRQLRLGAGLTSLLGPERRRQDDDPAHARRPPPAVQRARAPRRPAGVAESRRLPPVGLVPEREAVYDFLTGRQFVELARAAPAPAGPGGQRPRAPSRTVDLDAAADRPSGRTRRACASG